MRHPTSSPPGDFGDDGTYVVVRSGNGRTYAARVPIHERFHVYLDHHRVPSGGLRHGRRGAHPELNLPGPGQDEPG